MVACGYPKVRTERSEDEPSTTYLSPLRLARESRHHRLIAQPLDGLRLGHRLGPIHVIPQLRHNDGQVPRHEREERHVVPHPDILVGLWIVVMVDVEHG